MFETLRLRELDDHGRTRNSSIESIDDDWLAIDWFFADIQAQLFQEFSPLGTDIYRWYQRAVFLTPSKILLLPFRDSRFPSLLFSFFLS
jgi:hypothetical protein